MKALQVTNAESSFFETQLSALDAAGVAYDVAAPATGADGARSVADYLRFYPSLLADCLRDYDVIHANYGLLGPLALAQPSRPVVLSLWGSDVMGEAAAVTAASRAAARRADAVVAPSNALADALPGDVDATVIPFGVDTDRFRPIPRADARAAVGWETDRPVALFPYSPTRPVKDYPRAERVVSRAPVDVELRTISDVPYEDVPLYMNASDLVLVTSKRESGPMVVKEAAACNVPVVSTDVGFAADALADVSHSHVASTDEALGAAVASVVETGARSDGRRAVELLSARAMGDRLASLYRSIT